MASEPAREDCARDSCSAARFHFRATWNFACTTRSSGTTRGMLNNSAKLAISTPQATCTPSSGDCWPANLKRCGAFWDLRRRLKFSSWAQAADCLLRMFSIGRKRSFPSSLVRCTIRSGKLACSAPTIGEDTEPSLCGREGVAARSSLSGSGDNPAHHLCQRVLRCFRWKFLVPKESCSSASNNGRFVETWALASAEELDFLDHYSVHPEAGERIEVSLAAQNYMTQLAASMQCGFMVTIDYGYTRPELLAGRHRGTVTAFRQHSVSANPYEAPGEQDITAQVNFTAWPRPPSRTECRCSRC